MKPQNYPLFQYFQLSTHHLTRICSSFTLKAVSKLFPSNLPHQCFHRNLPYTPPCTSLPTPATIPISSPITTTSMSLSPPPTSATFNIVVLCSGGGRSLQNLIDIISRNTSSRPTITTSDPSTTPPLLLQDVRIAGVIVNKDHVPARARALAAGIPVQTISRKAYSDVDQFSQALTHAIRSFTTYPIHLVVLAGFLLFYKIPQDLQGKVINIHPSLLPKFGGKGMYGDFVHRAVIEAGELESGCTVHWVNNVYDNGEIILQRKIPVPSYWSNDNLDLDLETKIHELAAAVFEEEKIALPQVIDSLARQHFS